MFCAAVQSGCGLEAVWSSPEGSAGLLPAVGLGGLTPAPRDRGPTVLSGRHAQGKVGLETGPELSQDQARRLLPVGHVQQDRVIIAAGVGA